MYIYALWKTSTCLCKVVCSQCLFALSTWQQAGHLPFMLAFLLGFSAAALHIYRQQRTAGASSLLCFMGVAGGVLH